MRATAARNTGVDTLRGAVVVLMVAEHVVGSSDRFGMRFPDGSPWHLVDTLGSDVRMPLYAAIAGWVLAARPVSGPGALRRFLLGKARRLLLPLVVVGSAFVLLRTTAPGTNVAGHLSDLGRLIVSGVGHFWFLQALFLALVVVGTLDAPGALCSRSRTIALVVVTAFVGTVVVVPDDLAFFSADRALRLLPFVLLGHVLHRVRRPRRPRHQGRPLRYQGRRAGNQGGRGVVATVVVIAVVLFAARSAMTIGAVPLPPVADALARVVVGIATTAALLLLADRLAWRPLAALGRSSFAVYLLHVFATAPTRVLLTHAGVESDVVVVVVSTIVGVTVPVVVETTLGRVPVVGWAVFGRPLRQPGRPAGRHGAHPRERTGPDGAGPAGTQEAPTPKGEGLSLPELDSNQQPAG